MSKLVAKKARNEQMILASAVELFTTNGFDETSISDIVKGSGLARGTFYNYYSTKVEIWDRLVEELLLKVNATITGERSKAGNVRDFIYNAFYKYAELLSGSFYLDLVIKNQSKFREAIISESSMSSIYKNLETDLINSSYFSGLTMGQYKMTSHAMIATAIELLIQAKTEGEAIDLKELSSFYTNLFLGGLKGMQ